jgi:ABC-type lipoprotein release transport system permease subunit
MHIRWCVVRSVLLLTMAAAAAIVLPAPKATKVAPTSALRAE